MSSGIYFHVNCKLHLRRSCDEAESCGKLVFPGLWTEFHAYWRSYRGFKQNVSCKWKLNLPQSSKWKLQLDYQSWITACSHVMLALWQEGFRHITVTGTWIDVYSGILRRLYPWTPGSQTVLTGVSHSSRLFWLTWLYYMALITFQTKEILHFITLLPFGDDGVWKRNWGIFVKLMWVLVSSGWYLFLMSLGAGTLLSLTV